MQGYIVLSQFLDSQHFLDLKPVGVCHSQGNADRLVNLVDSNPE